MNNAKKTSQSGQTGRAVGLDQALPRVPNSQLSMRDLGLKHLEYKANPHAKMLADLYVPKIMEVLRRGKYAQMEPQCASTDPKLSDSLRGLNTDGVWMTDEDWEKFNSGQELTEEDRQALLELPL